MPYSIRRSNERGYADHKWLKTYHSFSFANYYNPDFMGFRDLRVINQDLIAPKKGFPFHDHQDMEILTFIIKGKLAHKDSMGNESIISENEIQIMSAGSGITHSEYNASSEEEVHLLQIWIIPDTFGLSPSYQEAKLSFNVSKGWHLIASKKRQEATLKIHQDVNLFHVILEQGKKEVKTLPHNRYGWLQMIEGEILFNEDTLHRGDGVAIEPDTKLEMEAKSSSRFLFFDLS